MIDLTRLKIPPPLELAIVVKADKFSEGFIDLHLQGLKDGMVMAHEGARIRIADLAGPGDHTDALQDAVLQLFSRLLSQPHPELRLS